MQSVLPMQSYQKMKMNKLVRQKIVSIDKKLFQYFVIKNIFENKK